MGIGNLSEMARSANLRGSGCGTDLVSSARCSGLVPRSLLLLLLLLLNRHLLLLLLPELRQVLLHAVLVLQHGDVARELQVNKVNARALYYQTKQQSNIIKNVISKLTSPLIEATS